jgi:hypothetical protein
VNRKHCVRAGCHGGTQEGRKTCAMAVFWLVSTYGPSYGCSECGRYFAVREKLMKPFVEIEYHRFAIAEQRRRSLDSGEQALAVVAIGKEVQDISSRTE